MKSWILHSRQVVYWLNKRSQTLLIELPKGYPTFTQLLPGIIDLDHPTSAVISISDEDSEEQTAAGSSLRSPTAKAIFDRTGIPEEMRTLPMNDFGGAETGDILPFSDRTSTRIHDALWTLPMNDFEGNETDDILPFCTAGFTKTPNTTRSAALTHSYTTPGTSTQALYNLAPKVHHNTLAEVHRAESPRPEKGD
ncbi:uncharacterized protein ACWYII_005718 isoform 1-T1 [Salvelinus alpinus]